MDELTAERFAPRPKRPPVMETETGRYELIMERRRILLGDPKYGEAPNPVGRARALHRERRLVRAIRKAAA